MLPFNVPNCYVEHPQPKTKGNGRNVCKLINNYILLFEFYSLLHNTFAPVQLRCKYFIHYNIDKIGIIKLKTLL